jgi:hypothetical protein
MHLIVAVHVGGEMVLELGPPTGLLFIPQIYEYGEPWWNDTDRKLKNSERNLPQYHFVHHIY